MYKMNVQNITQINTYMYTTISLDFLTISKVKLPNKCRTYVLNVDIFNLHIFSTLSWHV